MDEILDYLDEELDDAVISFGAAESTDSTESPFVDDEIEEKPKKSTSKKQSSKKKATKQSITLEELYKKINNNTLPAEANIIGAITQAPDLLLEGKIKPSDFNNFEWRIYFQILDDMYHQNLSFTEDNINFYLENHEDYRKVYDKNRGYDTILKLKKVTKISDFETYAKGLLKWNAVKQIADAGFPVTDRYEEFVKMSADDIYNEYTMLLNQAFMSTDQNVKTYQGFAGLRELNALCDSGAAKGIPFNGLRSFESTLLNSEVNGFDVKGQIYGLGAASGVGKSTIAIQLLLPTILKTRKPAVFIINEEDQNKFKKEAETWVINNLILTGIAERAPGFGDEAFDNKESPDIYQSIEWDIDDPNKIMLDNMRAKYIEYSKKDPIPYFNKKRFKEGHFNKIELELLDDACTFLEHQTGTKGEPLVIIVPLEKYNVSTAIKIIRKYASVFGVDIFVLDTLKESRDTQNTKVETWKAMERDLVDLYDVIKPSAFNVGLFVTYQLGKGSIKTRYLTNADIGQAKNIVDVMSVNLMIRRPFKDEYIKGKKQINYQPLEYTPYSKTHGKSTMSVKLSSEERQLTDPMNTMIMFICKNRNGMANTYQIVSHYNMSYNKYQEIGKCYVDQDF